MYLVQLLLPLFDNSGERLPRDEFSAVHDELSTRFGGLTSYTRAPAHGVWKEDSNSTKHDDVVLLEIMAEHLDRDWWSGYRTDLERRFSQDEIVVRAHKIERL